MFRVKVNFNEYDACATDYPINNELQYEKYKKLLE